MIRITDKSKCCGCSACYAACPVQCIVFRRDREGFDYPVADSDLCIDCGMCESVCPVLNPSYQTVPTETLAIRSETFVNESASGGVFPALAEKVLEKDGVVFGAVINEDMTVGHCKAENMSTVDHMRGSKYVQSTLGNTFKDVKSYLKEGRKIMFTGTPCQIAGLKSYLGDDLSGLITVDCACHGVPSPGLWKKYIEALESASGGKMTYVKFRDKSRSWMHYDFIYDVGRGEVRKKYISDPYMALFLQDMTLRPSCYRCPARNGRSGSDLTLADLWSVEDVLPELNDDKGVSLVMVNTENGSKVLKDTGLVGIAVDLDKAKANNGGFAEMVKCPDKREIFFQGYNSAADVISYMNGFVVRKAFHKVIYKGLRSLLSKLKRRVSR